MRPPSGGQPMGEPHARPGRPAEINTGGGSDVRAPAGHGRRDRRRARPPCRPASWSTPPSAAAATPPPCSRPTRTSRWSASTGTTTPSTPPPTPSHRFGDRVALRRARFDAAHRDAPGARPRRGLRACCSTSGSAPRSSTAPTGASATATTARSTCAWTDASARTAADVVNGYDEPTSWPRVLRTYGDERFATRIARAIVAARPLAHHRPSWPRSCATPSPRRPAARAATRPSARSRPCASRSTTSSPSSPTRIDQAIDVLAPGGRCAVLAYHSGEDRIVKERFRHDATGGVDPLPGLPLPDDVAARRAPRARRAQEAARRPRSTPTRGPRAPASGSSRSCPAGRLAARLALAEAPPRRRPSARPPPAPPSRPAPAPATAAPPRPALEVVGPARAASAPGPRSRSAAVLAFAIAFAVVACQVLLVQGQQRLDGLDAEIAARPTATTSCGSGRRARVARADRRRRQRPRAWCRRPSVTYLTPTGAVTVGGGAAPDLDGDAGRLDEHARTRPNLEGGG